MDNYVVYDKFKVLHSLTSVGTFDVYIAHPMCSDGYIYIYQEVYKSSGFISKIAVSKVKYVLSKLF